MNKELFSFLFLFIALLVGAFYYTNIIQDPFINSLNYFKNTYHNSFKITQETIDKHIYQAEEISRLQKKLKDHDKNNLLLKQFTSELNDIYVQNESKLKLNPHVELVRVTSYEKFGDLNRFWIDIYDYNQSKIYGLTYKEFVAGIIIPKNNRPLALLNKDIKCTYAVQIGLSKAPGIAHGNNNENILVKYIPAWLEIKNGDEVTTSGLDNTFFKGLKVGKVISSSKARGFQTAIIMPYYNSNNPSYFHMIKSQKWNI